MKARVILFVVILTLFGCKKDPTDEELTDSIFGTWQPYIIITAEKTFNYDVDSTFFYTNGIRDNLNFLSAGKMVENNMKLSYFVEEGHLHVVNELDTSLQDILMVNPRKLVLDANGAKVYYKKFTY